MMRWSQPQFHQQDLCPCLLRLLAAPQQKRVSCQGCIASALGLPWSQVQLH